MEENLKALLEKSKETLENIETKILDYTDELGDDAQGYWDDLKNYLAKVGERLESSYEAYEQKAELKSKLMLMEARDRMEAIRSDVEKVLHKVERKGEQELDLLALKAHLAKLEAQEVWDEKEKEFEHLYAKSKLEAEKLSQKALHELNEIYLKLSEIV